MPENLTGIPLWAWFLLAVAVLAALGFSFAAKKDSDPFRNLSDALGGSVQSGTKGTAAHQGIPYHFEYQQTQDYSGPTYAPDTQLRVGLRVSRGGAFEIRAKTDRGGLEKALDTVAGKQAQTTGDPAFDQEFEIDTELAHISATILAASDKREAVRALFRLGVRRVVLEGGTLEAVWDPFTLADRADPGVVAQVTQAVTQLAILARDLPILPESEVVEAERKSRRKDLLHLALLAALMGGIGLFGWWSSRGRRK